MSSPRRVFLEIITSAEGGDVQAIAFENAVEAVELKQIHEIAGNLLQWPVYFEHSGRCFYSNGPFGRYHTNNRSAEIPRGIRLFFFAHA